jgi:predicted MFS family arabinose efflux permease
MSPPRSAVGILAFAGIATAAFGPLLGGLITEYFGWHAIFSINVPLALLIAGLAVLWLPQDTPRNVAVLELVKEIDLFGMALFSLALMFLMLFLMRLDRPLWWALSISGMSYVGLIVYSLRRSRPFIDVRMLKQNVPLTMSFLRIMLFLAISYCILYGLSQWMERSAAYSPSETGMILLPMSILAGLCSLLSARFKSVRLPFVIGAFSSLIGSVCLIFVHSNTPAWFVAVTAIFFGVPMGTATTTTQAAIYIQAPASEIGTAAGLQRTFSYVGAVFAASLIGIVFGYKATDSGIHSLAMVMMCISGFLLIFTIVDRTLP